MKTNWDRVYQVFSTLVLVALLALAGLGTYQQQTGAPAAATEAAVARGGFSTTVHFEQGGGQLTVESGGKIAVASGGTLTNAGLQLLTPASVISVTNGAAFTPTAVFQPISSAGTVTPTITAGAAGQLLILENTTATTINLADSGTLSATAAIALGQYDTLTLISDGVAWLELSTSNN